MSMEVYVPQPSSVSVYLLVKSTVYVILVSSFLDPSAYRDITIVKKHRYIIMGSPSKLSESFTVMYKIKTNI